MAGAIPRMAIRAMVALALVAPMSLPSLAKTPGATHCYGSVCHRVLTLAETQGQIGRPRIVHASHYDDPRRDRFNPSLITSSGELFRPGEADNAASPNLPNGTQIAVYSPATRRGAIVRINNSGPYWGNRTLDLSRGLADKLGFGNQGVARVVIEVLQAPTAKEAKWARNRRYQPLPGFVGPVAGMDALRSAWASCSGSEQRWPKCADKPGRPPERALPTASVNIVAAVAGTMRGFGCAVLGGGKRCSTTPAVKPEPKAARRSNS